MPFYDVVLKDTERLIRVYRSHPVAYFWDAVVAMFFILSACFFVIPLFSSGQIGMAVFLVLIFTGFFLLTRMFVKAYFNSFIITDKRIIDWDQRGLFDRIISEVGLAGIHDVSYRVKGMFGTMFNYGTVHVQSTGSDMYLELKRVRDPEQAQAFIMGIKRKRTKELSN